MAGFVIQSPAHSHIFARTTRGASLSRERLHQISRLAAARTIPVTNAAKQENSRKSLTTLAMMPPVLRHRPMACPTPSTSPCRGQNVAAPARVDDNGGRCGDGATLMANRYVSLVARYCIRGAGIGRPILWRLRATATRNDPVLLDSENLQPQMRAPTPQNVTVRSPRPRDYLTRSRS